MPIQVFATDNDYTIYPDSDIQCAIALLLIFLIE